MHLSGRYGMSIFAAYFLLISTLENSCQAIITVYVPPPTSASCRDMTPFADQQDCTSYYQCFRTGATWTLVHSMCPTGGFWDDVYKACVEGSCGVDASTTTMRPTTTTTTRKPVNPPPPSLPPPSSQTPKTTTTRRPAPVTTKPTTTTARPTGKPVFLCTSEDIFIHPTDPRKYYRCIRFGRYYYYYIFSCPPIACFDSSTKICRMSLTSC